MAHTGFQKMNELGGSRTPFFFMVDFEVDQVLVCKAEDLDDIFFDVNGVKNHKFPYSNEKITLEKHRIPFKEYKRSFDKVSQELHYGNTFLLNLTRATEVKLKNSLFEVFLNSRAKYKLFYKNDFVCFSPEPFIG